MTSEKDQQWTKWLLEIEEIEEFREQKSIVETGFKQLACPTCANPFANRLIETTLLVDDEFYTVLVCEFCKDCPSAVLNSPLVSSGIIKLRQIFDCFVVTNPS